MIAFLIALLLYIPTTAFAESYVYVLFIPVAVFLYRKELVEAWFSFREKPFGWKYLKSVWLVILILTGITVNSLVSGISISDLIQGPLILMPLTFLAAYVIADVRIVRYILIFTGIEVFLGAIQYFMGVNSFFEWLPKYYAFINYDSFYHTRVFGLSENSSYLSQKVILGIILLYFSGIRFKFWENIGYYLICFIGIILTFGRTTIIVFAFTILLYLIAYLINKLFKKVIFPCNMSGSVLGITGIVIVFVSSTFSFWKFQFTRLDMIPRMLEDGMGADMLNRLGLGGLEMAGRKELWAKSLEFIADNPWLGNGSQRFFVNGMHAHNSFIEYAATNGLILFALMLLFIALNVKIKTLLFTATILLYSMGQYGIFWDISFLDIVFIMILFFSARMLKSESNENNWATDS